MADSHPHAPVPFVKMHGLGNDFVVLDARRHRLALDGRRARAIADRRTGVGCDQIIVLEPATSRLADVFMRIHNADGAEVEACGNGARCVASVLMREKGAPHVVIETVAGLLDAESGGEGMVVVDMGPARLDWRDIPLSEACDTNHVAVSAGPLRDACCVNVGNPHAVFFVPDAEAVDLGALGPALERHAMFPERANIEVAQILSPRAIRMRVWERGVGITRACGSGACAVLVAASRRALAGRRAEIALDGGTLGVEWQGDGHVTMTGPVATSFTGALDPALLA